jgi:hypothetical protein
MQLTTGAKYAFPVYVIKNIPLSRNGNELPNAFEQILEAK